MRKKEDLPQSSEIFDNTQANDVVYQDPLYETPPIPQGQYEIPDIQPYSVTAPHLNTAREYSNDDINEDEDIYDDLIVHNGSFKEEEEEIEKSRTPTNSLINQSNEISPKIHRLNYQQT